MDVEITVALAGGGLMLAGSGFPTPAPVCNSQHQIPTPRAGAISALQAIYVAITSPPDRGILPAPCKEGPQ